MVPTRDHSTIRQWAILRNATPAEIRLRVFDSEPAVLTFILGDPDVAKPDIYPISWESFFAQFDLLGLAFAHDDQTSRFDILRAEKSSQRELSH